MDIQYAGSVLLALYNTQGDRPRPTTEARGGRLLQTARGRGRFYPRGRSICPCGRVRSRGNRRLATMKTGCRASPTTKNAAPEGGIFMVSLVTEKVLEETCCAWQAWQRPTLPRLEPQYHGRWGVLTAEFGMGSGEFGPPLGPPGRPRQMTESDAEDKISSVRTTVLVFPCLPRRSDTRHRSSYRASNNDSDQADRAIPTGKLHALPRFHTWPIDVVVFHGSQARPRFEVGFPLRCFQRLSRPHFATRLCGWRDNRSTRGAFIPVLSY